METSKSHFQYNINKLFHIIGIICLTFIFAYTYMNLQNRLSILFFSASAVLILLFLFAKLKAQINNMTNKQMYLILLSFIILMFLGMAYTAHIMLSNLLNDLGTVYYSVGEILKDGSISRQINAYTPCALSTHTSNNDYFVIYPNNQFVLFFLLCYYKILSAAGILSIAGIFTGTDLSNYMGSILNVFMISMSVIFGFFLCKKIWNNSGALMYLIFSFLFLPYYINAYRFYTDTLSLPFVLCSIFLFFKFKESSSNKQKLICSCLTGAFLSLSILLKGSLYVLLAAIIVYFLITIKNKRQIIVLGVMLISLVGITFMWHQYIDHCGWVDTSAKNKLELPVTHWIMMASTGDGGFRQEDLDYTLSFPDKAAKTTATINKTLERIRNYNGIPNYLTFEFNKIGASLADGKFAQSNQLPWYKQRTWIYDYILEGGLHYNIFYNYITIFIAAIYILIFLSFLCEVKKKEIGYGFFLNLCFIGMVLFFMLWEVKSRYFLDFTPVYFMCGINALDSCTTLFLTPKIVM